jgi:hypothetical protein
MTPEERALTLAEDFIHKFYGMEISYSEYMYQSIFKSLADAILEEREACAKIAETYSYHQDIAKRIRARGEE